MIIVVNQYTGLEARLKDERRKEGGKPPERGPRV